VTAFWRSGADGISILIKVQPKSRRPGLLGTAPSADGPRLRVGVSEPAESGRANDAVRALLADWLDVPRSAVVIATGATSRDKLVRISGDPAALTVRLTAL
jgi:uncharacterized protein YggU (UPF0235/DUF167 family)